MPQPYTEARMSSQLLNHVIEEICGLPLPQVQIVIHGGEPLILGKTYLERVFTKIRQCRKEDEVLIQLQTNGVLVDEEWTQLFQEYKVGVGVSLDGPKRIHDLHRHNLGRNGTHDSVVRAIKLLGNSGMKFGILAVVTKETASHVDEVYDFFFRNELSNFMYEIDFLPCRLVDPKARTFNKTYTLSPEEWYVFMKNMFDLWITDDKPAIRIRYFRNLMNCLMGGEPQMCEFMGGCGEFVTIEPTGDVYPCDNLLAFDELCFGNLAQEPLSAIMKNNNFEGFLRKVGNSKLLCESCEWYSVCRGGCVEDKYVLSKDLSEHGYYCESKKRFFTHVAEKTVALLSTDKKEVKPISDTF
jgi:uncharacterized protein